MRTIGRQSTHFQPFPVMVRAPDSGQAALTGPRPKADIHKPLPLRTSNAELLITE